MIDKKTLTIIILVILLIGLIGYSTYNYFKSKFYIQGINFCQTQMNSYIIQSLNAYGYVPFQLNNNNQTINVQLILKE